MASTTIGGVKVKIGADITGFETGLQKTRKGLNSIGKWAGAAAAAVAVGAAAIVKSQLSVLDSLAKTSDALGIQQEKLQALQHIGQLTGTSNEMVNRSLERMQRNLGMAARMGGASANALEDLGISVDDIIKLKPDEQMEVLAVSLAKVENQALKASIANDIFGRNGTRMLKMLDQLKNEGLDPTVKALDEMGVSLTRIETSKVESFNDAMFKSSQVTEGLANKLTVRLAPILEAVSNLFVDGAKETQGYGKVIDTVFDSAITIIGVFADSLQGIKIISKGLEIAFRGAGLAIIKIWQGVITVIERTVDQVMSDLNTLISGINNIPGIDIDKILITESEAKTFIDNLANTASKALGAAVDELHNKMMEPLPSESIKKWVAEVEAAATIAAEKLTSVTSGGTGGGEVPKIDTRALEAAQLELENLLSLNDTKLEIINSFELEKLNLLQSYKDQDLISKEQHEAAITEIEENAASKRMQLAKTDDATKKAMTGKALNDIASLMNTGSKKAFAIGKAAAISNAAIKGVESAVSAWSSGMSVGGPLLAAAYTGASLIKTGTMIGQIKSQQFGGASSPVSFSGGLPTVNTSGGGQSQQATTNVSIDIVGSEGSTFSRSQIESLIESINDATGDGVVLNTGG